VSKFSKNAQVRSNTRAIISPLSSFHYWFNRGVAPLIVIWSLKNELVDHQLVFQGVASGIILVTFIRFMLSQIKSSNQRHQFSAVMFSRRFNNKVTKHSNINLDNVLPVSRVTPLMIFLATKSDVSMPSLGVSVWLQHLRAYAKKTRVKIPNMRMNETSIVKMSILPTQAGQKVCWRLVYRWHCSEFSYRRLCRTISQRQSEG